MVVDDRIVARVRRMNVGRGFEEPEPEETVAVQAGPLWEGEMLSRADEHRFSAHDASEDRSWW